MGVIYELKSPPNNSHFLPSLWHRLQVKQTKFSHEGNKIQEIDKIVGLIMDPHMFKAPRSNPSLFRSPSVAMKCMIWCRAWFNSLDFLVTKK
jgi:hypothetical protein